MMPGSFGLACKHLPKQYNMEHAGYLSYPTLDGFEERTQVPFFTPWLKYFDTAGTTYHYSNDWLASDMLTSEDP